MTTDRDDRVAEVLSLPPGPGNPRNSEGDIVPLRDGRLLLAYSHFTNGWQDNAAGYLACRLSADEGRTWGEDRVLLPREGAMNSMSVSFLRLPSGDLALFYLVKNSGADCRLVMRASADDGQSWSTPVLATPEAGYHVVNNARVVQLSSGRLVAPVSRHAVRGAARVTAKDPPPYEPGVGMCFLSDDLGRTWRRSSTVLTPPPGSEAGLQEPGVIELRAGELLMLCRTDLGVQYRSHSSDGGDTWTPAEPSDLASPLAPATLRRLPGGELLLIWNDHARITPELRGKRTPLVTAISRDEGNTWEHRKVLEDDPQGWYCYHSCTFVGDHAFFTYVAGSPALGYLSRLRVLRVRTDWFTD